MTDAYLQQMRVYGLFHAYPRDNLLVRSTPSGPCLVFLAFGLTNDLPPEFPAEMARITSASSQQDTVKTFTAFRRLGFVIKHGGVESLLVLHEVMSDHSVNKNKANADPGTVEQFNEELPQAVHKHSLVEAPSDLVFVWRMMGLSSGIGKQTRPEVNPIMRLIPHLMSHMGSHNEKPNSATIPEDSVETATPKIVPRVIVAGCRVFGGAWFSQATTPYSIGNIGLGGHHLTHHRSTTHFRPPPFLAYPLRGQKPLIQEPIANIGPRLGPLRPAVLQKRGV